MPPAAGGEPAPHSDPQAGEMGMPERWTIAPGREFWRCLLLTAKRHVYGQQLSLPAGAALPVLRSSRMGRTAVLPAAQAGLRPLSIFSS